MKIFGTVKQALSFIKKNTNTGVERIINDSVHFGVGVFIYTYSQDAKAAGLTYKSQAFTHLDSKETELMLTYLLNKDGYLTAS